MKLSDIKGFGPKRLALLEEMHIQNCEDLLRFFPQEYLNYDELDSVAMLSDGDVATLQVTILSEPSVFYTKGKSMVSVRAGDSTGKLTLRWMNQPYRVQQVERGMTCFVHGRISKKRGTVLYNPQVKLEAIGILPVYNLPKGLSQSVFREAIRQVIDSVFLQDILPEAFVASRNLMGLSEAIRQMHFPTDAEHLLRAKFRIQMENALLYFIAVSAFRERVQLQNGYMFSTDGILERFLGNFSFQPTNAQLRVMQEIEQDMASRIPMNRLIQGDVGSGKTLIAEYALFVAAAAGKQSILLAPTEILAKQHYRTLQSLFGQTVCLLTGSLSSREQKNVLERIENGDALVAVGTHALFSDRVRFRDLGLVITDEQHRFGVNQRAKIASKGIRPDVLVMSATPIPRTLALLLYADLSLSVVDELPKGRKPIQTMYVPKTRRDAMYRYIADRVQENERAYVVCPLIDEAEGFEGLSATELINELRIKLPKACIGLLHGRMRDSEKSDIMERFRTGEIQILVSTTVVEVGVDVPNATYMVIEGADHFGLATLHQLRGRVGRSDLPSSCYLLCDKPTKQARERIQMMVQSNDGFLLAQKDMEMRGYGDLFGVRQSGYGESIGFLESCPIEVLEQASVAAAEIIQTPSVQNNNLIAYATERYLSISQIAHN